MNNLVHFEEPCLEFGYGQALEDPRDGLTLFGPLDEGKPYGIRSGVVGTSEGLRRFSRWVGEISRPVRSDEGDLAHPDFPGFEAVFGVPWSARPTVAKEVSGAELDLVLRLDEGHIRVFRAVDLYAQKILEVSRDEDVAVDVWFVVIPESVYQYGRPTSRPPADRKVTAEGRLSLPYRRQLQTNMPLFEEDLESAEPYRYDVHFRNQLKARFLHNPVPIQVVRESTIARHDFLDDRGRPLRSLEPESAVAWNLTTAAFYKAGGRPWKLSAVRRGVCYVGLAFKVDDKSPDSRNACCAAQMFLDSGDGVVFRGAVGPWYNPRRGDFHLSKDAARQLMSRAVSAYKRVMGSAPEQVFIHGKVRFNDGEWAGFVQGAGKSTAAVGVYMRANRDLKLFRDGEYPVMRGLAYVQDDRKGYLCTKGFIPRLDTYPGWEVPWPLQVEVSRGQCDINAVLRDVLALTKLNYNACIYGDGMPVTLRFADAVGDVLTAGPLDDVPPLAFKYYI